MKKQFFTFALAFACLAASGARPATDGDPIAAAYAGIYSAGGGGDPMGGVNLILSPDHVYAFTFFGGISVGTWKTFENYVILQPDTTANEDFYLFGLQSDTVSGVALQFDGFTDKPAKYRFDDDPQEVMHPVFNPDPNYLSYPYRIRFAAGEHRQVELVSFVDLEWHDYPEPGEEYTGTVYTFTLDPELNDFKLWQVVPQVPLTPILGVIKGGELYVDGHLIDRRRGWDEVEADEREFMEQVALAISQPLISKHFGSMDEDGNWVEVPYPVIPYTKKEVRTVRFDNNNLFEASEEQYEDLYNDPTPDFQPYQEPEEATVKKGKRDRQIRKNNYL